VFSVLIHPNLYQLLRESTKPVRARVHKTLARLRDGLWGGGTRVKRLAGVQRPVYEARTDAGDRLLFTVVHSANRLAPASLTPHVQVWDWVHHDQVSRKARRNPAPEAEFLEMAVLEEFDITELPPHPDASFNDVPCTEDSDKLLHFLIPPAGLVPRTSENLNGAVRWYLLGPEMLMSETEFQRVMDEGGSELELKLTREQYEVLRAPGPVLVAGSAGSGKTTIALHRLAQGMQHSTSKRVIYLSYSRWLVEHAQGLYRDLHVALGGKVTDPQPDFFTFEDFYRKLAPRETQPARPATFDIFVHQFRRSSTGLEASLVWEELRSILKGACLDLGKSMLTEAEYLDLGRKRAPLFVNERPEIFRIAKRYQEWLTAERRLDQIDLCRLAFRELRHGRVQQYDIVVCDETQDLTELEIHFVLCLQSSPNLSGVFLAGDSQQIVNPSGFRWAEVRQAIPKVTRRHVSAAPQITRLRRNFRSVRPIVELANAVILLRRDMFGRSDEDEPEDAVAEGPVPLLVTGADAAALENIAGFGPRCAVVVNDARERDTLRKSLETTRVFDVREAKGLEFDSVVLWKIAHSASATLDRAVRRGPDIEKDADLKHFLQHLYVAVTRARRHLAIFEGPEAHSFWESARFRGRFELEPATTLSRVFRQTASPTQWATEGDYFFKRQRYRQAAECYRRAGSSDQEIRANAMFNESHENWPEALRLWQSIGDLERQPALLERLGRLEEALAVCQNLGRDREARLIQIRLLEKQNRWTEAAAHWEGMGDTENAAHCHQKAGNRTHALKLRATRAEQRSEWAEAARCWLELSEFERAALCFRKARDPRNANISTARLNETRGEWSKAATLFKKAGDEVRANECRARHFEAKGKLLTAADLWLTLGHKEKAEELRRKGGDPLALDRLEVQQTNFREPQIQHVRRLAGEDRLFVAIEIARARRRQIEVALRKTGLTQAKVRAMYEEEEDLIQIEHGCAARLAERAGKWADAETLWLRAGNKKQANNARRKRVESVKSPMAQAKAWLKLGEWNQARKAFERAGKPELALQVTPIELEAKRDWDGAAAAWASIGQQQQQARCRAQAARQAENWAAAARYHREAGQTALAMNAERKAAAAAARVRRTRPIPAQPRLFDDESQNSGFE
jgi:DNA helicase-2/ATP-dependent DNA helicase PcrA